MGCPPRNRAAAAKMFLRRPANRSFGAARVGDQRVRLGGSCAIGGKRLDRGADRQRDVDKIGAAHRCREYPAASSTTPARAGALAPSPARPYPTIEISGNCSRSARPNEPPIRPVPRIATRRKGTVLAIVSRHADHRSSTCAEQHAARDSASCYFLPLPAAVASGLSQAICLRSSWPTFSIGWFLSRSSSFVVLSGGRPCFRAIHSRANAPV